MIFKIFLVKVAFRVPGSRASILITRDREFKGQEGCVNKPCGIVTNQLPQAQTPLLGWLFPNFYFVFV